MKLIVIDGKGNCGKTTTINYVYKKLIEKEAESFNGYEKEKVGEGENDFKHVLYYQNMSIAFFSPGDSIEQIQEAVEFGKKFDILICACNSYKKREADKFLSHYNAKYFHKRWIYKNKTKNYEEELEKLLAQIFLEILEYLNE